MSGKKYFYALGQSVRARGLTKSQGEVLHGLEGCMDYARIAYDAGFRGLGL
jgi:hypothetical protein